MLVDTRSQEAWNQGHARGAVHIPKPDMPRRIPEYPTGTNFVVYCWGPGCNGAQRAGLIISELGYVVKEMIGGFEYWAREGLAVDAVVIGADGTKVTIDATRPADSLTNITPGLSVAGVGAHGIACDC